MALEYFLYRTDFNNTLVGRSKTSFAPLPPNTGEIFIDFFIPKTQPLYLYRESGGNIVLNDEETINDYLKESSPPIDDEPILYGEYVSFSGQTQESLNNKLSRLPNDWEEFSVSEKFIDGDYILMEDSEDGFSKKKISKDVFAEELTGGFGQYSSYAESLNATSTTSTVFQNKLTKTTDAEGIQTIYRIGWTLQLTNNGNNRSVEYRITVDGNVIEQVIVGIPRANSFVSYAGFQHLELTAGSHTITVDYRVVDGGTATIQNVRVEFWRAAEDEE